MQKKLFYSITFALLLGCRQDKEAKAVAPFLGTWHMAYIKNIKYPFYEYQYTVAAKEVAAQKVGYLVHMHITCPKCDIPARFVTDYEFPAQYNAEIGTLDVHRQGYVEALTLRENPKELTSNKYPGYLFKKTSH